ncbi:MAG: ATP-binding protein [Deltaproteobacteria bacterium]|nr:MAG: ATP-binding protein [Deltaproteobacteria bacterium]
MIISRYLENTLLKTKKSFLLLGPRQTGKSTLIKNLKPDLTINLADEQTYLDFVRNPRELSQRLTVSKYKTVFIDEVQRLPSLLNTLQTILDEQRSPQFYLTGSSARKLKRGHANLLPGRLHTYSLGTLCASELEYKIHTSRALELGTLPAIYTEESSEEAIKTLRSYSLSYLKEEVQAEALTRNLEGFSRFLFVAASFSGQFLDFTKLSREAQIPRQSAMRYFEILEDTLIVHRCEAFAKSDHKRFIQHPKFYFFDTGVLNALLGNFKASDDRKGLLFEHLFFNQLLSSSYSRDQDIRISTYRTEHGAEVDFIVQLDGQTWALELKASNRVGKEDLRGIKNFSEFYKKKHTPLLVYFGDIEKNIDGVAALPWQEALKRMASL